MDEADVGPVPLRRLSRLEYNHTLVDLLGAKPGAADRFVTETVGPSGVAEGAPLTAAELERLVPMIEEVVEAYVRERLLTELGCDAKKTGERACAERFARWFGRRAFRHTPNAADLAALMAVYDDARGDLTLAHPDALGMVAKAALLSPAFHYVWGAPDQPPKRVGHWVALGPAFKAARLAYYVWQSMPDDELLDAAEQGRLATPRDVAAQAKRMLTDPVKGPRGLEGFLQTFWPLHTLAAKGARDGNDAIYQAAQASAVAYLTDLVAGGQQDAFATLLAGRHAFLNEELAKAYGVPGVTGPVLRKVPLESPTRVGLFTQPAFLAATADTTLTTIIRRGRFVYERLAACGVIPTPDGDIPEPPARKATDSVRQHLSTHAQAPICAACHKLMDPLGFAFDGYGPLGADRGQDDYGKPIDTTGVLEGWEGSPLRFEHAADLLSQLATRPEPMRCFAQQVLRFALRSALDGHHRATENAIADRFVAGGGDLQTLFIDAAANEAFAHRKPSQGEVLQ